MDLLKMTGALDGIMWGQIMIYLCLGAGIYFSVLMRFPQLRLIKDMINQLHKGESSENGVSSFQGFAVALGGRVGTGNIVGVATAIFSGGPGAVFWMWAIAFLGAGSAFIESALAQVYKEEIHGEYRGGPAYYIEKGLGNKFIAALFAFITIIACASLSGIQTNSFVSAAAQATPISAFVLTLGYTLLAAYVILGGGKRIAKTAELIVPFMSIGYIIVAFIVMAANYDRIGEAFSLIFTSAFSANAIYGGLFGQAVTWGVKRGIFSNEAGQGTGAQAAGAAEVSHPAKQGLVQAFSVYCDTWFVCTTTALMILVTGSYNVANPSGGFITEFLPGVSKANFTQAAINDVLPGFGGIFIAVALFLFTFTTVMANYFYVDSNVGYLFRKNSQGAGYKWSIIAAKIFVIGMVFTGGIMSTDVIWNIGSIGVGMMAWINIIVIILLTKPGIAILKDYEAQKKLGLDPVFKPERCGIDNADLWNTIVKRKYDSQMQALEMKLKGDKVS